ncbi:glycosyltransferase [Candidatus Omnitrophota bacterium]
MKLSVVIPTLNERDNVVSLVPSTVEELSAIMERDEFEIILVDGGSKDGTKEAVEKTGAVFYRQKGKGYGNALIEGFNVARGEYLITMDADLSHRPDFIRDMWRERESAEVIVASRYIEGGSAEMPILRKVLSAVLNIVFRNGLSLKIKDISSGFRLIKKDVVKEMDLYGEDFDILEEILIKAFFEGWKIKEIPFCYRYRMSGKSHAKLLKFGISYMRTFLKMWKSRNSILSADYDERAYFSKIPIQRYWQRKRHAIIEEFADNSGSMLDVGCGSSRTLGMFGHIAGLDISMRKLRYIRKYGKPLVRATVFSLPFRDGSFHCVICSEVIEHIQKDKKIFDELTRVLKKDGTLVLGTPDYGSAVWRAIEALYKLIIPGGYADEHISHYSREEILKELSGYGYRTVGYKYILKGELIVKAIKKDRGA